MQFLDGCYGRWEMKLAACGLLSALVMLRGVTFLQGAQAASDPIPIWAYGTDPAAARPPIKAPVDHSPKHLPGSTLSFTEQQIQDPFGPADWFTADHPAMPDIVARGRKPAVWACALCHYPNGKGRPENASVVGFPRSYFVEQMHEFRDGQRRSADARKKNTAVMSSFAKAMTEEEIQAAADYFCSMKWTPWIKVVETETVPKTRTSVGMYLPIAGAGTERLGERIIEVPVDPEATEVLRDPHSGFIAYAPVGSIRKGKELVTTGGTRTSPCAICHGADLKGLGPVPGVAGRSPSYLVRQLYDMQQGTRNGTWTELMEPVVKNLTDEDMLNIAAYAASLQP
jgi:cytochrome c553